MKIKFWAVAAAVFVCVVPMLLALTSSTPWGKVKYSFAVVLIGSLVYYIGDKI